MIVKVALAQINPALGDVEANLAIHLDYIDQALRESSDLIVFPELSLTGDRIGPNVPDVSLTLESDTLAQIAEASQKIDVVVGLVERGRRNLYDRFNSSFYFAEGKLLHRHRKLFLVNYSVFEEGKHFVPGNNLEAFDSRLGRQCLLVCNDAWHAAAPYIAALDGAEVALVPTNSARGTLEDSLDIPATWEHMNRAYSAMLGYYTVFVNRVGVRHDATGAYPYWGGSEIIGPDGCEVVKAPYDEEALVFGEVDVESVARQRYQAPIIRDARLWIIRQEINRLAAKRSEEVGEGAEALALDPDGSEPIA